MNGAQARARELVDARRRHVGMARWPAELRPTSSHEAYAIQQAVVDLLDEVPVGWKLGCTSAEMQQKLGSDGPITGRAFERQVFGSGARIADARPDMWCVEAEFAFRMGADLPPRREQYTRDEVRAAIATLHPAIEQVESRFTDWQGLPIHDIVADNASHGRLVLGDGLADWRDMDLAACPIRLFGGDTLLAKGHGSAVLGDPMNAMVWLANHARERGLGLRAGEVVTTGTCTGLTFVQPRQTVSVQVPGVGSVQLTFVEQESNKQ